VLAACPVVGVQVADDEAATVKEHHHRRHCVIGWRPIDPDVDRSVGADNAAVLHPKLRMKTSAREVAQLLSRRRDAAVRG
jgi:hypothetical protein